MPYDVKHSRSVQEPRNVWRAMGRGLVNACPNCNARPLFRKFLKPHDKCPSCTLELSGHRADDLPPYITIAIAGHVIVWGVLIVEKLWAPALWLHMAIWLPLTLVFCLWLMQPVKGAVIGLQWSLRMHGFEDEPEKQPGERGEAA